MEGEGGREGGEIAFSQFKLARLVVPYQAPTTTTTTTITPTTSTTNGGHAVYTMAIRLHHHRYHHYLRPLLLLLLLLLLPQLTSPLNSSGVTSFAFLSGLRISTTIAAILPIITKQAKAFANFLVFGLILVIRPAMVAFELLPLLDGVVVVVGGDDGW